MNKTRPSAKKKRGFFMPTNPLDESVTSLPEKVRPKAVSSQGDFISPQYIAGFFDGDGHINACLRERIFDIPPKPRKTAIATVLTLAFTNTNLPLLKKIKEQYGGNITHTNTGKSNWKIRYRLYWNSHRSVKTMISIMYPYVLLKKPQFDEVLQFFKNKWRNKSTLKDKTTLYNKMRKLNKRGKSL